MPLLVVSPPPAAASKINQHNIDCHPLQDETGVLDVVENCGMPERRAYRGPIQGFEASLPSTLSSHPYAPSGVRLGCVFDAPAKNYATMQRPQEETSFGLLLLEGTWM